MKDERISDRTLERMRLGELDAEESRQVLEALEASGEGVERLEAMVAADEAFLEKYPPEVMAARIRERRAQRARQQERASVEAGRRRAPAWLAYGAAAAGVAAVAAAFVTWGLWTPGAEEERVEAVVEAPQEPEVPVVGQGREPAGPHVWRVDWKSEVERPVGSGGEVALEVGQIVALDTRGVERARADVPAVAEVTPTGERLYLEAASVGTTKVRFFGAGQERAALYVRVAEAMEPSVVEAKAMERSEALEACVAGGGGGEALRVRFIVEPDGRVRLAYPKWSTASAAAEGCVVEEVRGWTFPKGEARTGTVLVSGPTWACEPGEDC